MSALNIASATPQIVMDFWETLCNLPRNENPAYNNTGIRDEIANKNKDVFYLSVNHEGPNVRNCEVNSNQSVVISSLSVLASEKERPGSTDNQLRTFATVDQQGIVPDSQYVIINNQPVLNLNTFKVQTDVFDVDYPLLNLFSANQGNSHAVADGTYLVLPGFEKGTIVNIRFGGTIRAPDSQDSLDYRTYYEDLRYKLTVV